MSIQNMNTVLEHAFQLSTHFIFVIHHLLIILDKLLLFCIYVIYRITSQNPLTSYKAFQLFKEEKIAYLKRIST